MRLDVRTGAEIPELRAQMCELSSRSGSQICLLRRTSQEGKKREASVRRHPLPLRRSGGQHLSSEIPQATVEAHVLLDRGDASRVAQPSVLRPPGQAAPKQIFLHSVERAPEAIPGVLDATAAQQLRRVHAGLRHVGMTSR